MSYRNKCGVEKYRGLNVCVSPNALSSLLGPVDNSKGGQPAGWHDYLPGHVDVQSSKQLFSAEVKFSHPTQACASIIPSESCPRQCS